MDSIAQLSTPPTSPLACEPATPSLSRREFSRKTLGSILTFTLLETLCRNDLFAAEVKPIINQWVAKLDTLGHDVQDQKLGQIEWQKQVEALFANVSLPDLLTLINFDKLTSNLALPDNGAKSLSFKFPEVEGIPRDLVFGRQIFGLKKNRSVVPHGHNNMATAFLVLKGELHGRHYDRLEDAADHYLIRPTIDRNFKPGEHSSVSDEKDNIHWFKANTEPSFIFNIHVLNVRPGNEAPTGRVYLNPQGEKLADGTIRAAKLNHTEAHKLFG